MKKILLFSLLTVALSVCAEEAFNVNGIDEPQWESFAPKAYVDVQEPKGIGKFNETAKYWYKRRVNFEKSIQNCRDLSEDEDKFSCYQKITVKEYQANSEYNAKLEAEDLARRMPYEVQDKTDNMLPVSNYLNNFSRFQPNELRGY